MKISYKKSFLVIILILNFTFYKVSFVISNNIIIFGSCSDQKIKMNHWKEIVSFKPNYLFLLGDNVYGDYYGNNHNNLVRAYNLLDENKYFKYLKNNIPIISIWDDHDYGINDGGKNWIYKDISKEIFLSFFNVSKNDIRYKRQGIYKSYKLNISNKLIKVIALDTRYFKDNFKIDKSNNRNKKYTEDYDASKTILGSTQWKWFEREVKDNYDILIILSSYQVISKSHGWEKWNNFPHERKKLFNIISQLNKPTIILSGDRHVGGIYKHENSDVYEFTASSFNKNTFYKSEQDPLRIGELIYENNYGVLEINNSNIIGKIQSGNKDKENLYNSLIINF